MNIKIDRFRDFQMSGPLVLAVLLAMPGWGPGPDKMM